MSTIIRYVVTAEYLIMEHIDCTYTHCCGRGAMKSWHCFQHLGMELIQLI